MEEKSIIFWLVIVSICLITLNVMNIIKSEKIDCYQTYFETGKITTKCETYLKDLKIEK